METHTELTTPPGRTPRSEAPSSSVDETYVPGLEPPREPRLPSRLRRVLLVVGLGALAVAAVLGIARVVTSGQSFDPSLGGPEPQQTTPDGSVTTPPGQDEGGQQEGAAQQGQ